MPEDTLVIPFDGDDDQDYSDSDDTLESFDSDVYLDDYLDKFRQQNPTRFND